MKYEYKFITLPFRTMTDDNRVVYENTLREAGEQGWLLCDSRMTHYDDGDPREIYLAFARSDREVVTVDRDYKFESQMFTQLPV